MTITAFRHKMSLALLEKVAGPDGKQVRERIHATPGPRWFADDSPIQRVHGCTSMYIGGIRALLLQSLHPLAMAAVADHSGYRSDAWGRLARTATFIATTTFGTSEDAQQAVDIVRAVHARIEGTTPDGRGYRADDPHLLLWVHCAEIDSFLHAHQLFGPTPLTASERDTYVAQCATIAHNLGAEGVPTSHRALRQTLRQFTPELRATDAARDVATFLLHEPPLPGSAKVGYHLLSRAAVDSLPPIARDLLALPTRRTVPRALGHVGGQLGTRAMYWLTTAEPMRQPQREPG